MPIFRKTKLCLLITEQIETNNLLDDSLLTLELKQSEGQDLQKLDLSMQTASQYDSAQVLLPVLRLRRTIS